MFERFTHDAREVVVTAQAEARALGHTWIGTEHLLAGLTRGTSLAAGTLRGRGVDGAAVRRVSERFTGPESLEQAGPDAAALETIGIDLDAVRRRVEEAFGPGALDRTRAGRGRRGRPCGHRPFSKQSKALLERALRESLKLRHRHIGTEHVLLAVTADPNTGAARVLAHLGVQPAALRERVLTALTGHADSA